MAQYSEKDKISKSNQDPRQTLKDKEGLEKIMSTKSQHFEPGTWVVYKNERFLLLCYRPSDGKMVIDNERTTLALDTYACDRRRNRHATL